MSGALVSLGDMIWYDIHVMLVCLWIRVLSVGPSQNKMVRFISDKHQNDSRQPPPIVQLLWKLKGQDHDTKCRSPNSVVNSLIYFKKKTKMSLVGPLSHVESWTVKVQVKEVKLRKSFLAVTAPRIVYEYFTYRLQCSNSRGGCACCALHYSTWLVMHLGRVQQLTGRIGRTIRTT